MPGQEVVVKTEITGLKVGKHIVELAFYRNGQQQGDAFFVSFEVVPVSEEIVSKPAIDSVEIKPVDKSDDSIDVIVGGGKPIPV